MTMEAMIESGLIAAFIAVALAALRLLQAFLEAKTRQLTAQIDDAFMKTSISDAEDAIMTAVIQIAQECADDLKNKSSDGKLTPDEVAQLREEAYRRSVKLMGDKTYQFLREHKSEFQEWILAKVDASARSIKY